METLILKNKVKYADRWHPTDIDTYKASIRIPVDTAVNKRLRSNFAYSMQYIEYIEQQLKDLNLHSVIKKMLYKSYIITGMGIIESLFVYILHSTNNWKTDNWHEVCSTVTNRIKQDSDWVRFEIKQSKQVDKYDVQMDLDSMIKKIEKKHCLTIDHSVFPAINRLRELRNRVHLHIGNTAYDHDYSKFNDNDIQMMRRILYSILTTQEICVQCEPFAFIFAAYKKSEPKLFKFDKEKMRRLLGIKNTCK